jgi:hypothetical protein
LSFGTQVGEILTRSPVYILIAGVWGKASAGHLELGQAVATGRSPPTRTRAAELGRNPTIVLRTEGAMEARRNQAAAAVYRRESGGWTVSHGVEVGSEKADVVTGGYAKLLCAAEHLS